MLKIMGLSRPGQPQGVPGGGNLGRQPAQALPDVNELHILTVIGKLFLEEWLLALRMNRRDA